MAKKITSQSEPTMPSRSQAQPVKIVAFALFGLLFLGGIIYAGYWYGVKSSNLKSQMSKPQPKTQIQETPTPKPTSTPTPSLEDETRQWKTYTNMEYSYSVKYPSNSTPKEEPAAADFLIRTNFWDTVNDTVVFGIEVREASLAKAVEDIKGDFQRKSVIMELRREDKIVHQGYDGYRLEYGSEATVGVHVIVIINNDTYSYLVSSDKSMIDQILSTFQFLE